MARAKDKGKGKAIPSEQSRLLSTIDPEQSSSTRYCAIPSSSQLPRRRRVDVLSILLTVTLFLLSLSFLGIFLALLLGYSYGEPASQTSPEAILQNAVRISGPTEVEVLNMSDAGLWVRMEGLVGVDTDWVMGFRTPDVDEPWWERARRWFGRRGVEKLDEVTVELSSIGILPAGSDKILVQILVPPLTIPLTPSLRRRPDERDTRPAWLSPMSVTALIIPSGDFNTILRFAGQAWATGKIEVSAKVDVVHARGGTEDVRNWKSYLAVSKENVLTDVRLTIPSFPGFPPPGTPLDFLSLLSLDSYSVQPGANSSLLLSGSASIPFPVPSQPPIRPFNFPLSLPFTLSVMPFPSNTSIVPVPLARVYTSPIALPPPDFNLSIAVSGNLLPFDHPSPLLTQFLSAYLAARSHPILISSPPPHPGLPPFLSSFLSAIEIPYLLAGPSPPPRFLDKVGIHNMRILPSDKTNEFLASGDIIATVTIPKTFESLSFNVSAVQPDVLIYDGPPLSTDMNAFAQLNAPILDVTQSGLTITAPMDSVPVQILPGREAVFREFARKIIFKGEAWAGVKGTTSVWSTVGGFGEISVHGVKVQGGAKMGRGSFLRVALEGCVDSGDRENGLCPVLPCFVNLL